MKKLIMIFLVGKILFSDIHADATRPYHVLNLITEVFFEHEGAQQVSIDLENKIRNLLKKHNFDFHNTLNLRSLNPWRSKGDVFVYSMLLENPILFVDAKWLTKASEQKFEFLILREATRIADWHLAKKILMISTGACLPLIALAISGLIAYQKNNKDIIPIAAATAALLYVAEFLSFPYVNRYFEYKADQGAIEKAGSIEGGVEACKERMFWEEDFESNCSQHPLWKFKRTGLKNISQVFNFWWFMPSDEQRLNRMFMTKTNN